MKSILIAMMCAAFSLFVYTPAARGAETEEDLQKRFQERYPQIAELKKSGKIGETSEGYLDFVQAREGKASDLVNDENADRRKLYDLIAKKHGTDAASVAKRAAQRNFEKAKPGEFLKEDGRWRKKE